MHAHARMQAEQRATQAEHLAERQVLLRQNSVILDDFMARLKRPMSAAEAQTLLKASAGLDIPEGNPLNLRPLTAAALRPWLPTPGRNEGANDRLCVAFLCLELHTRILASLLWNPGVGHQGIVVL